MRCAILVCLFAVASAAETGDAKKGLTTVLKPPSKRDASAYAADAAPGTQTLYGAAPGQYLVRSGEQGQHPEYLGLLQQLAAQQQVGRHAQPQPQILVPREPQAHASRFSNSLQLQQQPQAYHDARYLQRQRQQQQQQQEQEPQQDRQQIIQAQLQEYAQAQAQAHAQAQAEAQAQAQAQAQAEAQGQAQAQAQAQQAQAEAQAQDEAQAHAQAQAQAHAAQGRAQAEAARVAQAIAQPTRRPTLRRPPTEQQLLQQSFFRTNELQGQLMSVQSSRPNPIPQGRSVFQEVPASRGHSIHAARLQASLAGVNPNAAAQQQAAHERAQQAAQQAAQDAVRIEAQRNEEVLYRQQVRLAEAANAHRQQLASLQAQEAAAQQQSQYSSQQPQLFPQPSPAPQRQRKVQVLAPAPAPAPAPGPGPAHAAPEQYLRETSPPAEHPALSALQYQRHQHQQQQAPEQIVYYNPQDPSPAPDPAYLQQHQSTSDPTIYQRQPPTAGPSVYLRPQPTPDPSVFLQQQPTADPTVYLRQQPTADPSHYLRHQQIQAVTPAGPAYRQQVSAVPESSIYESSTRQPQYASASPAYRTVQRAPPTPEYAQVAARPETPIYYSRPEPQPDVQNEEFIASLQAQAGRGLFGGQSSNDASAHALIKSSPAPSPSRSSIFVATRSSTRPTVEVTNNGAESPEKEEVPVLRLPTPTGQRALTQSEFQALVAAGFDIRPAEASELQPRGLGPATFYQTSPKYQRSYVTASPLENQTPRPRTKLQQVAPQQLVPQQLAPQQLVLQQEVPQEEERELVALEPIIVPDEPTGPSFSRRRPNPPRRQQGRYPLRYRNSYQPTGDEAQQQEQVRTYLRYDSVPEASNVDNSRSRASRGRRPIPASEEEN